MPRVAALLDMMQVSDVMEALGADTFLRPIYAGNAIQKVQATAQKRIVAPGLLLDEPFVIPRFMRLLPRIPLLRNLPTRLIGIGVKRVSVDPILLQ